MPVYSLKSVQKIPVEPARAWNFFSDPSNLPSITPPQMAFKIISKHHGDTLYAGQILEYYVKPFPGVRLYWMTEITHVLPMIFFADEQRYGPYAMWHHQHRFKPIDGGVEMTDIIHYKNPMGILGTISNSWLVRPQLHKIFGYRYNQIETLFGKWPGQQASLEFG